MKVRKYEKVQTTVQGKEPRVGYMPKPEDRMVELRNGMVIRYSEYIKDPKGWNEL